MYIYALGTTIVVFYMIVFYINNYGREEQKNKLNYQNNKIYLFCCLGLFIFGLFYVYNQTNNGVMNLNHGHEHGHGHGHEGGSSTFVDKSTLKSFEADFINSIKNQEVDVGVVPF